jgi:Ni,Fe-hydrogenase III small subunit
MVEALRRTYVATPDPKRVVAVGDCGAWRNLRESYATVGAVANVVPVDVAAGLSADADRTPEGILGHPV